MKQRLGNTLTPIIPGTSPRLLRAPCPCHLHIITHSLSLMAADLTALRAPKSYSYFQASSL